MNRLLPALIAPLVISSYCTPVAATQYITVVDPRTGAMHVAVVNGIIQTQSNPVGIAPAQQITITPPNSSPHTQGKVDFIDLNELTNAATPQIIQAILRNKEAIDRENAALLEKQQQQLNSRKTPDIVTPPDLDKTAGTDPIGNNNKKPSAGQDRPVPPQQSFDDSANEALLHAKQPLQQQNTGKAPNTPTPLTRENMAENFVNAIGNINNREMSESDYQNWLNAHPIMQTQREREALLQGEPLDSRKAPGTPATSDLDRGGEFLNNRRNPSDLDRVAGLLDNIMGNIVQKTIDEKKQLLEESNHSQLASLLAQIKEVRSRLEAQNAGKPSGDAKPTGTAFGPKSSMSLEELAQYAVGVLHQTNTRPELESPQAWWEAYVASAIAKNLPKADMPKGANRSDVLAGTQGQYGTPSQQSLNQLEQSLTNAASKVTTDPWASYIYAARNEVTSTVPTASLYDSKTGHYAGLVKGSLDGAPINGTLNMQVNFDNPTISGSMNFGSHGTLTMGCASTPQIGCSALREQTSVVGTLQGVAFGGHASGEFSGKLFGPNAEQVGGTWVVNILSVVTERRAEGQFVGGQVAPK